MKNFKFLGFILTLFTLSLMIVSCEEDPGPGGGGGGDDEFPTVVFNGSSSYPQNPSDTVTISVTATASVNVSDKLGSIEVLENGSTLPFERVLWNGDVIANPLLMVGTNKDMAVFDIGIIVNEAIDSTNLYKIVVKDDGGRTVESAEISIYTEGPSMMSGTVITSPGSLQGYPLSGAVGSSQLSTLSVLGSDGSPIATDRIFWDGPMVMENPIPLAADYLDGFSDVKLEIRALSEETTEIFSVVLTDANALTSTEAFQIITEIPGTPVDVIMGTLLNQAGPSGTGGLDLDNGEGTGTGMEDVGADIKDNGNDSNGNWLMQISPINGSQIKRLIPANMPENFSFENIQFTEELEGFFQSGTDYNSEQVLKDDIFAVERDGVYYVIQIAEINDVAADNSDNYVIDIKK